MSEPTLAQIFGANTTQSLTDIVISKSDLTGLTASANNTAESLLVALLLKAKSYLTQANYDLNNDQSLLVVVGFSSLTTRGGNQYRQDQITVTMSKIDTSAAIDPDDY